jgi:DNA gyrase subunit B
MAFLNKGLPLFWKMSGKIYTMNSTYEGGIVSFVEYLNKNRTALHSPPIYITGEKENADSGNCSSI